MISEGSAISAKNDAFVRAGEKEHVLDLLERYYIGHGVLKEEAEGFEWITNLSHDGRLIDKHAWRRLIRLMRG